MSDLAQSGVAYMQHALELAKRAWGRTHPNPMVGAVIVEDGAVVAEGWHHAAGQAHAEVEALRALGRQPHVGATMYVTLEPCSTCGRTGACTDAIIEAGIRQVVIGAIDPNPAHAGKGIEVLRAAGIEVIDGVLAEQCADLNLIFNHWILKGRPFVAAKIAVTLDGKFAAASGHSQWVTSDLAREDSMRWRRYFPAIAVGADTVLCDDPSLTSRIGDHVTCPRRFVFDRYLRIAGRKNMPKLFTDEFKAQTVVLCAATACQMLKQKLIDLGICIWVLPIGEDGHLDWQAFRERCAVEGIIGLYIETGPRLATALLEKQKLDYLYMYQAPKFMSDCAAAGIGSARHTTSMSEAIKLNRVQRAILGEDTLVRGHL